MATKETGASKFQFTLGTLLKNETAKFIGIVFFAAFIIALPFTLLGRYGFPIATLRAFFGAAIIAGIAYGTKLALTAVIAPGSKKSDGENASEEEYDAPREPTDSDDDIPAPAPGQSLSDEPVPSAHVERLTPSAVDALEETPPEPEIPSPSAPPSRASEAPETLTASVVPDTADMMDSLKPAPLTPPTPYETPSGSEKSAQNETQPVDKNSNIGHNIHNIPTAPENFSPGGIDDILMNGLEGVDTPAVPDTTAAKTTYSTPQTYGAPVTARFGDVPLTTGGAGRKNAVAPSRDGTKLVYDGKNETLVFPNDPSRIAQALRTSMEKDGSTNAEPNT